MSKTGCTIVIRCLNEEKHIERLLHGIQQQTVKSVEIVVVDSGSTDNTLSIVSSYPVEILTLRPEEFSFGRSLNLGCAAASGDFIVLASAHVYPLYRDWLENLLNPFDTHDTALVYGKQVGGDNTRISEHRIFEQWFPENPTDAPKDPFCNNANAAIRKNIWNQLPYNEEITGLEDIAWANEAIKKGLRIAYQPSAVVAHIHDESYSQVYHRYRREAMAFKRIFPNQKFTAIDFLRLLASNVVGDYFRALVKGRFVSHWRDIPLFRLSQFRGTYHGFRDTGCISDQLKRRLYYAAYKRSAVSRAPARRAHENLRIRYELDRDDHLGF
jgi:glycosyltransferase involved in cell wall biosynthesis